MIRQGVCASLLMVWAPGLYTCSVRTEAFCWLIPLASNLIENSASLLLSSSCNYKLVKTALVLMSLSAAACGHYLVTECQNLGDHAADAVSLHLHMVQTEVLTTPIYSLYIFNGGNSPGIMFNELPYAIRYLRHHSCGLPLCLHAPFQ